MSKIAPPSVARPSAVVPQDKLRWEVLVAGTRSPMGTASAAAIALGYFGAIPVSEVSEAISTSGIEHFPSAHEALALVSVLRRLPPKAMVHAVVLSTDMVHATQSPESAVLPVWLQRHLRQALDLRRVSLERASTKTPRLRSLLKIAQESLSQARPLEEVQARMA